MTIARDRIAGAIYGLAFGDAYGYQVEFDDFATIVRTNGLVGPDFPRTAVVSDDTQMSLAVWHALNAADPADTAALTEAIIDEFLLWRVDPDNTRAPGGTCLRSLRNIAHGAPWVLGTDPESKGCGTVMRAPWIGLHPAVEPEDVSTVAQLQAAITHGHPTAVVAADVLAHLTRDLATGAVALRDAARHALTLTQHVTYRPVLGNLWFQAGYDDAEDYIADGVWEMTAALGKVRSAAARLAANPLRIDPCKLTGDGWVAEEALATALLIIAVFGDRPELALRRAATTGGDSDSIACIVGALIGAARGDVWPATWHPHLEPRYQRELAAALADTAQEVTR